MKIAITGCNGSIGRRVIIRALAQEHTVVGIDIHIPSEVEFSLNPAFSFLQVDLTDYEKLTKALHGCDGVIHLAGVPQPVDYGVVAHNWYEECYQSYLYEAYHLILLRRSLQ